MSRKQSNANSDNAAARAAREEYARKWPGGLRPNGQPKVNAENDAAAAKRREERKARREVANMAAKCPHCGGDLAYRSGARVRYYAPDWAGGFRVCTVVGQGPDGRYTLAQAYPAFGTEAGYLFRDVHTRDLAPEGC